MELNNKICIVTGSAQGIGKAIAKMLLEKGAKVCISDVNDSVAKNTFDDFKNEFGKEKVHMVVCDVTKQEQFANLFNETEKFFNVKYIDVLVNNAGVSDKFGWRKCMEVNIIGVMNGGEIALERMSKSPTKGTVINVASTAALVNVKHEMVGYGVSKHGVVAYTRIVAEDFADHGVSMKAMCPLWVDTEMVATGVQQASQKMSSHIKKSIKDTGGLLSPSDIADSVFKLLTECENGTVLFSAKNTPNITIPDVQSVLLMTLIMIAKLVGRFTGKTILKTGDQKVFLLLLFILFAFVFALVF